MRLESTVPVAEVCGYLVHVFLGLLRHVVISSLLNPGPRPPSLGLGENSRSGARHGASEAQPGLQAAYEASAIIILEIPNGVQELSVRVLHFGHISMGFLGRLHLCGHCCSSGSYRGLAITEIESCRGLSWFILTCFFCPGRTQPRISLVSWCSSCGNSHFTRSFPFSWAIILQVNWSNSIINH